MLLSEEIFRKTEWPKSQVSASSGCPASRPRGAGLVEPSSGSGARRRQSPLDVSRSPRTEATRGVGASGRWGRNSSGVAILRVGRSGYLSGSGSGLLVLRATVSREHGVPCLPGLGKHLRKGLKSRSCCSMGNPTRF